MEILRERERTNSPPRLLAIVLVHGVPAFAPDNLEIQAMYYGTFYHEFSKPCLAPPRDRKVLAPFPAEGRLVPSRPSTSQYDYLRTKSALLMKI